MNYEGQICRAPMEKASFMLPVMVGCSYNQCKFCDLFKHLQYREIPIDEIEAELIRVKRAGGSPRKIFLGDGNAFCLKTDRLVEILNLIRNYFPECQSINMDATVTSIHQKSDAELKRLYDLGVRHLYLGIESGLDDILKFMHKDHSLQEAYIEIARLQKAGLQYDAHIMTGIAGKGRGQENASALAEFFHRTKPKHIVNFSLFLHRDVDLYQDIDSGVFKPADELENLIEEKALIEKLNFNCEHEVKYDGLHDFIEFRVKGTLPKDKEIMIAKLDEAIAEFATKDIIYSFID